MGVASRAATPITVVASPLQRHGSRGDVRGPTSRTVTRNKQRWLCSERGVFPFGRRKEREERGGEGARETRRGWGREDYWKRAVWTGRKVGVVRREASCHGASSDHLVYIRRTPRRKHEVVAREVQNKEGAVGRIAAWTRQQRFSLREIGRIEGGGGNIRRVAHRRRLMDG